MKRICWDKWGVKLRPIETVMERLTEAALDEKVLGITPENIQELRSWIENEPWFREFCGKDEVHTVSTLVTIRKAPDPRKHSRNDSFLAQDLVKIVLDDEEGVQSLCQQIADDHLAIMSGSAL